MTMWQQAGILALLVLGLALTGGRPMIGWLHRVKFGQVIREEGPSSHQAKAGTPSMGGWIILAPALVGLTLVKPLPPEGWLLAMTTLGYAGLGFLDDWLIIKKRSNKGLLPRQKLLGQVVLGGAFAAGLWGLGHPAALTLPFSPGGEPWAVGLAYWGLVAFMLVATSNAVNLTDGLDGLAASTVAIAAGGLAVVVALRSGAPAGLAATVVLFLVAIAAGCLGFLWFNAHPAQVFMGDTGSLGLGAALAGAAVVGRVELWLVPIGAVFIAETLSVMAQVTYFRRTGGKRLFKMSPLHHHFELSGWKETQVVARFSLVALACAAAAVVMG
ncbi:MAG: phospho-N-acetylmuramoyl-pentapeptide-transferase [Candidatus Sericytochromatia bacterium]|nr:phospho-N-acetylmuramoyl-pentapeptide-transferase [Candidatus Sericytochromatia bacterium]